MRLSYSALQLFKDCPYLFKYVYLERHKLPKSKEQIFGTLLHTSFKKTLEKNPLFPALEETLSDFDERWGKSALLELFTDKTEALVYQTEAHRILTWFHKQQLSPTLDTIALERSFMLPIRDPKSGTTHAITGRIDRIDRTAEGGFHIIDYKTSRSLPTEENLQQNLQLILYHMAVHHMWPSLLGGKKIPVKVSLMFVRHGETLTTTIPAGRVKQSRKELLATLREIEASDFPARSSQRCASYPYKLVCPYFKDQFRKEKPKIAGEHEVATVVDEYHELKTKEKQIKRRIAELSGLIKDYLDEQSLEAIFSETGGVTRTNYETYRFNQDKVRSILEPIGKWEEVITLEQNKLKKLLPSLSESVREQLATARESAGQRSVLRLSAKS